jgi:hypothetical protein
MTTTAYIKVTDPPAWSLIWLYDTKTLTCEPDAKACAIGLYEMHMNHIHFAPGSNWGVVMGDLFIEGIEGSPEARIGWTGSSASDTFIELRNEWNKYQERMLAIRAFW